VARDVALSNDGRMSEEYARHLSSVVAKRALKKSLERTS
jgi:hypothetical protein